MIASVFSLKGSFYQEKYGRRAGIFKTFRDKTNKHRYKDIATKKNRITKQSFEVENHKSEIN